MPGLRRYAAGLLVVIALASSAAVGVASADDDSAAVVSDDYDPWRSFNEKMFFFNHDVLDRYLLKPVAK